jgi:hypothetical protein
MHIVLAATEPPLADAWQRFCGELPNVTIHRGSILDVACDAVCKLQDRTGSWPRLVK